MPLTNEARAVKARASRNRCGCCFRDNFNFAASCRQAIPTLIARHVGADWLSGWAAGRRL